MAYAGLQPKYKTIETGELATNICSTAVSLSVGNNNNYALTNTAGYSAFRVTLGGSGCVLTGMIPDTRNGSVIDGQIRTLINSDSTNTFTITNQDSNSSSANRFTTGQSVSLLVGPGESVSFIYSTSLGAWEPNGGSSSQAFATNVAVAMSIVFG